MDGLTNGRIIHVDDEFGDCQAAIIVAYDPSTAEINAVGWHQDTSQNAWLDLPPQKDHAPGIASWHWIERA